MVDRIDPKTLHEDVIIEAIKTHCSLMGSKPYYQRQEIEYFRKYPDRIVCFRDELGRLRAYHQRS